MFTAVLAATHLTACVTLHALIPSAQQAFAQGGASQEQRDRLLQTTDRLDGQSRRLEDSKRTMMEIEDTGEMHTRG